MFVPRTTMVVVVPGMRPLSKADSRAVMATGRMTFERAVRTYNGTAVVTDRIERTRAMADGVKREDDWRFTKVYLRRDGTWRVISFSNVAP